MTEPSRGEGVLDGSPRGGSFKVSGSRAQPRLQQEERGLHQLPRPMGKLCLLLHLLLPTPPSARPKPRGAVPARGGPPAARAPGVGRTWNVVTRGRGSGPAPTRPQYLGGGAQPALPHRTPQVGGPRALSAGGELGTETGDPPERAQPSLELDLYKRRLVLAWDACAFSNIPTATLRGQLHPYSLTGRGGKAAVDRPGGGR